MVLDTPREVAETYGSPPNLVSPPPHHVNTSSTPTTSNSNHPVNTTSNPQPSSTPQPVSQPKQMQSSISKLGAIIEVSEDGSSTKSSPTTPSTTPSTTPKITAIGTPVSSNTTPSKDSITAQPLSAGKTAPTFKRLTQSADKARSGSDTAAMKKVAEEAQQQYANVALSNSANNSQTTQQQQPTLSHSYSSAKHHRASISGYANNNQPSPNPAQIHRTFSQEVRKPVQGAGVAQSLSGEWKMSLQHSSGEQSAGPDKDLVIHPSFVFLQLQQTPFYSSKPKRKSFISSTNFLKFISTKSLS